MRRAVTLTFALALFALLLLGFPDLVEACPTCQDSLAEQDGELGRGFYWSILLMIGVPFSLLLGVVVWLVAITRRQAAAESPGSPPQASHA